MKTKFKWWLYHKAFGSYECYQCLGQEWWQGCHCQYYDATAPGKGPTWMESKLQKLWYYFYGVDL